MVCASYFVLCSLYFARGSTLSFEIQAEPDRQRTKDKAQRTKIEDDQIMSNRLSDAAVKFLRTEFHLLPKREQRVLRRLIEGRHVTHDTNLEFDERLTFGQRVADRVAAF